MRALPSSRTAVHVHHRDPAASAGTSISDAREALAYWRGRARRLPWHRRAARLEARMLAARWRERLLLARLQRLRIAWLAPALTPLARGRRQHTLRLARRLSRRQGLARRIMLATAIAAIGSLAALVFLAALLVHIAAQVV